MNVAFPDGEPETYGEDWRHKCEVEFVASLSRKGDGSGSAYLRGVEAKRGSEAAQRLYSEVKELSRKGTR